MFELCSGEINGHRFLVVCDPEVYLEKEYGINWTTPMKNFDKQWYNLDFKHPIRLKTNNLRYYDKINLNTFVVVKNNPVIESSVYIFILFIVTVFILICFKRCYFIFISIGSCCNNIDYLILQR